MLTNWVVHGTPALGWPNLLTPRSQWNAEPGSSILMLLLFRFLSPCHDLSFLMLPFSPAILHKSIPLIFHIFSMFQKVQHTCFQDPRGAVAEPFQPPAFFRNLSPTLELPHSHRTWVLCSLMCVNKHRRPLESGPATSPYQSPVESGKGAC